MLLHGTTTFGVTFGTGRGGTTITHKTVLFSVSARAVVTNKVETARMDSLRGSSVKLGMIQKRLAWPLRKDDSQKSRSAK